MSTLIERLAAGDSLGYRILEPQMVIEEARREGLPLHIACVMLFLESGGGRNVYGNDAVPNTYVDAEGKTIEVYPKRGPVTPENYAAYKAFRGNGRIGRQQGVGPAQLTYFAFQDQADAEGGCWITRYNCRVGFRSMAANLRRGTSVRDTFSIYNTGQPAANSSKGAAYAGKAATLLPVWQEICREEVPPLPSEPTPPPPPAPTPPAPVPPPTPRAWWPRLIAWLRRRRG